MSACGCGNWVVVGSERKQEASRECIAGTRGIADVVDHLGRDLARRSTGLQYDGGQRALFDDHDSTGEFVGMKCAAECCRFQLIG